MLKNIITKSAKYVCDNPAPFLRYTTFIINLISMAAQCGGIALNKKIPKKEKNFLLLQESVNGILELATFMTIATGFEKWGKSLVEKGVIIGTKVGKNTATFNKGVTVLFSIIGTVLALNLVTPLLRNPIINLIQKKFGKGQKISLEHQALTIPILPSLKISNKTKFNTGNPFATFERTMQTNIIPPKRSAIPRQQPVYFSGMSRMRV